MSSVNKVLLKAKAGTLTCSKVLEIMMAQPTHDETSHAQMHLLDSFQWNPLTWKTHYMKQTPAYQAQVSEADHALRKQTEWAPAAHLTPKIAQKLPTYSGTPGGPGLHMDEARLAQSDKYDRRTGHGELPGIAEKSGQRLVVLKKNPAGKGAPQKEEIASADIVNANPARYAVDATYVQDTKTGTAKIMTEKVVFAKAIPIEPARPAHSMFPDSESMVLHLTAALLSDAGLGVLTGLDGASPGGGETYCIYSKTAAKVVRGLKNAGKAPEMLMRTKDTDMVDKRIELASHSEIARNIDHVVVVLRKHADGSLLIVTAYPSDVPTSATIGLVTGPDEDVEELTRSVYKKTTQTTPLKAPTW